MNMYKRLDAHLQQNADGFGPIRGSLSTRRIGMIWLAANFVVTTLLTGTLFVPGVSFVSALAMIVVGTLIGAVVLTLIGNIGTRTGLPTMAITRGAFGTRGSLLPVAANFIILMGWSWVQAMLAGVTVNYLLEPVTGFSNPILFAVLCQATVVCLAILGHEGIAKVEPWLAVVILAIMAYVFVTAFTTYSPAEFAALDVDESLGFTNFTVLDIVVATAISWTVLSADFNRLAKSSRAGIIGSGIGYTLSTVLSMALGATALGFVILSGQPAAAFDPTVIVAAFGTPLALVVFISVMATNTMVVYGMVTSVVNAQPRWKLRFLPTGLVIGAISILGSTWMALLNQFTDFLFVIGAFFVPVFAIMIVDYYIIRRGNYTRDILHDRGGIYWYAGGINWFAVAVWVVGALVSYVLTYLWPSPVGATMPAFVISFLLYFALSIRNRRPSGDPEIGHLASKEEAGDMSGRAL
ncbi:cytosine permease [Pseudarthrobacter sp. NamE5]|uniref:purine-cytosine permease family protein n=1 Tax=Pseudarthrobacter sp. NamE5 TaxID=2576839 RepID=UPI00110AB5B8|nr:cytosine permease [Pseudarthrobacter sp. NamE5]TLM83501.1 purine-cytosine transporter [Pseudarthrobacter sp. NamE5]